MTTQLEAIVSFLIRLKPEQAASNGIDPTQLLNLKTDNPSSVAQALNTAFLITLSGVNHPSYELASNLLDQMTRSSEWGSIARFYQNGLDLIHNEIELVRQKNPVFAKSLNDLFDWIQVNGNLENTHETQERYWSVFFPEATGILTNREERISELRKHRTVEITELNLTPITDPARQILFTSNVLLTLPKDLSSIDQLPLSDEVKQLTKQSAQEAQRYWYDHPIQLGVELDNNEIVHGLRGLMQALEFERIHGSTSQDASITCVLSVSVTHSGLREVAKSYLEGELARTQDIKHLHIYGFTEEDTKRIIEEILVPAASHFLERKDAKELLDIFGVDGEYARHYSFLKAISAFWSIFINPELIGTFKLDLDQVFPQDELLEASSGTAYDHFRTPLWGAFGMDTSGKQVELGMLAGALVNERDISKSLFTPDVPFPDGPLTLDEYVFFSKLPQALSTRAEMLTRYNSDELDGKHSCIQRIHVTGGTTGILIDSLRRYRPFTPSFIGRAEDQAFILSTISNPEPRLTYVHEDGLIMRHDKEVFAQEAIKSARIGKLIGDYIRLLYFSAYARVLVEDITELKAVLDPFTGCFISWTPITVAFLRFALFAASLFTASQNAHALEFIMLGTDRISSALDFISGVPNKIQICYEKERNGWHLYYDLLQVIEDAIQREDQFALSLQDNAKQLVSLSFVQL